MFTVECWLNSLLCLNECFLKRARDVIGCLAGFGRCSNIESNLWLLVKIDHLLNVVAKEEKSFGICQYDKMITTHHGRILLESKLFQNAGAYFKCAHAKSWQFVPFTCKSTINLSFIGLTVHTYFDIVLIYNQTALLSHIYWLLRGLIP